MTRTKISEGNGLLLSTYPSFLVGARHLIGPVFRNGGPARAFLEWVPAGRGQALGFSLRFPKHACLRRLHFFLRSGGLVRTTPPRRAHGPPAPSYMRPLNRSSVGLHTALPGGHDAIVHDTSATVGTNPLPLSGTGGGAPDLFPEPPRKARRGPGWPSRLQLPPPAAPHPTPNVTAPAGLPLAGCVGTYQFQNLIL